MRSVENKSKKSISGAAWKALGVLPLALPVALASFGVWTMVLLLLEQFHGYLIWTGGLAVSALVAVAIYRYGEASRPGGVKERQLWDLLVLIAVIAWVLFNVFFTSEHVFTNRDPATYAIAGAWLSRNSSLRIPMPELAEAQGVRATSAGFHSSKVKTGIIEAQGSHLLPALIGSTGKLVGNIKALRINSLFGGIALLAMYAYARLLVRPGWAATATAAIAASMPMLYFSRDTYTEPLTMAFIFGGLALIWAAQEKNKKLLWLLGGLTIGAAILARIDAWLAVVGLAAFAVVFVVLSQGANRREAIKSVIWLVVGLLPVVIIGLIDLWEFSSVYYDSHKEQIFFLIFTSITILVTGAIAGYLLSLGGVKNKLDAATRSWRAPIASIFVITLTLLIISRPIWMEMSVLGGNSDIGAIQHRTGDPVGSVRYSLYSMDWLGWYVGSTLVSLGIAGLAYLSALAMKRKDLLTLAGVMLVGGSWLLYAIKPSITPDHIWASRRYLPIVLPGLAIFGLVVTQAIYEKLLKGVGYSKVFAVLFAVYILLTPLVISRPIWFVRDTAQLSSVIDMCNSLPNNSTVVWLGMGRLEAVMPTRTYCGLPAVGYRNGKNPGDADIPSKRDLAAISMHVKSNKRVPVIAVYGSNSYLLEDQADNLSHVTTKQYKELERTVRFVPRLITHKSQPLLFGEIESDGTIQPINRLDRKSGD